MLDIFKFNNYVPFKFNNQKATRKAPETKLSNNLMSKDTFLIQNKKVDDELKKKKDKEFSAYMNIVVLNSLFPR